MNGVNQTILNEETETLKAGRQKLKNTLTPMSTHPGTVFLIKILGSN